MKGDENKPAFEESHAVRGKSRRALATLTAKLTPAAGFQVTNTRAKEYTRAEARKVQHGTLLASPSTQQQKQKQQ